jgi:hypothetical protein
VKLKVSRNLNRGKIRKRVRAYTLQMPAAVDLVDDFVDSRSGLEHLPAESLSQKRMRSKTGQLRRGAYEACVAGLGRLAEQLPCTPIMHLARNMRQLVDLLSYLHGYYAWPTDKLLWPVVQIMPGARREKIKINSLIAPCCSLPMPPKKVDSPQKIRGRSTAC